MSDMFYYFCCVLLTLGVLAGISLMSRVKMAAAGNLFSALCMALAIVLTLYKNGLLEVYSLWLCLAVGLAAGLIWAQRIKMIEMPQVVALLNGFGGAASALVAMITLMEGRSMELFALSAGGLALAVGMVTLTGSLVAAGKLHKILAQGPVVWTGHQRISMLSLGLTAACVVAIGTGPASMRLWVLFVTVVSGFFGVAFSIRVGGADMPITISLLNSLSGVAGSIAGMAVGDPLLVAVGGVVGASGLLLTQIMCRAMNRNMGDILAGKTSIYANPKAEGCLPSPVKIEKLGDEPNVEQVLKEAKKVIIVPGYGMALAQAQHLVKQLHDALEANGAQVDFAVHPVAGRMPGHMNVLLAEAEVPYEKLREMDEINSQFAECDLAVIIGANDVVNPAARDAVGTPIYGMPILAADAARYTIICNYDMSPGYAGVENPLYSMEKVFLMQGDAQETVRSLIDFLISAS